jgi:hypothetical protein
MSIIVQSAQVAVYNPTPIPIIGGKAMLLSTDILGNLLVNIQQSIPLVISGTVSTTVANPALAVSNLEAQGSPLLDAINVLIGEVRALRMATVADTCDGGRYRETDFDPAYLATSSEFVNP